MLTGFSSSELVLFTDKWKNSHPGIIEFFIFQNMVHFEKIIPDLQDLALEVRKCSKDNTPPTKEDVDRWWSVLKHVSRTEHKRLFIIMTAQWKGWQFAKELDFYKSSKGFSDSTAISLVFRCLTSNLTLQVTKQTKALKRWLRSSKRKRRRPRKRLIVSLRKPLELIEVAIMRGRMDTTLGRRHIGRRD